MISRVVPTGPERAYQDHRAVLDAVVAGDGEAAEKAARGHVTRLLGELRRTMIGKKSSQEGV
jgi:DNA-binding GntR family transcriptional regulator